MLSSRHLKVLLGFLIATSAGCFGGGTPKLDPWQEYLIAQEIWKNERVMLDDFERSMGPNPTEKDQALHETLKQRFEKASAHVKAVRAKLPKE